MRAGRDGRIGSHGGATPTSPTFSVQDGLDKQLLSEVSNSMRLSLIIMFIFMRVEAFSIFDRKVICGKCMRPPIILSFIFLLLHGNIEGH